MHSDTCMWYFLKKHFHISYGSRIVGMCVFYLYITMTCPAIYKEIYWYEALHIRRMYPVQTNYGWKHANSRPIETVCSRSISFTPPRCSVIIWRKTPTYFLLSHNTHKSPPKSKPSRDHELDLGWRDAKLLSRQWCSGEISPKISSVQFFSWDPNLTVRHVL
jgi:hypothetical protein